MRDKYLRNIIAEKCSFFDSGTGWAFFVNPQFVEEEYGTDQFGRIGGWSIDSAQGEGA